MTYSEAGRIQEFACNPLETSSREAIIEDGYQIEGVGVEFMQYCAPVKSSFVEKKGLQNLILTANATVLVDYIWVREKEGGEGEDWPSCPSLDIPRENEECSFDGVTKSPVSVSASNDGKVAASAFVQSDGKKVRFSGFFNCNQIAINFSFSTISKMHTVSRFRFCSVGLFRTA